MLEEAKNIRIRRSEGDYNFDNKDIEHKNSWEKKMDNLEKGRFQHMPKIAIHTLNDEGNLRYMQIKRDKIWTTLGWSFCGNVFGVGAVRYFEANSEKYKTL